MIQWPESLITAPCTLAAAKAISVARRAIGMITANGQDWHRQLALGK